MSETLLGDIVFIILISGLIYGLLRMKKATPKGRLAGDLSASDDALRKIFDDSRVIALFGFTADPMDPAGRAFDYLREAGYRVFAVGQGLDSAHGRVVHGGLDEIRERVDLVVLFPPAGNQEDICREVVANRVPVLWVEESVLDSAAMEIAGSGGLTLVMDRSLEKEHRRLAAEG